jgi:hypothetical protein
MSPSPVLYCLPRHDDLLPYVYISLKGYFSIKSPKSSSEEVMRLLDSAKKWDFEVSLGEAQNFMGQILDECVEGLEKCWWGEGEGKPFHPSLITLAEKLGFNVERFWKVSAPGIKS